MINSLIKRFFYLFLAGICFIVILGSILFISSLLIRGNTLNFTANTSFFVSLSLLVILIIYTFSTWLKIGRDPIYTLIPRYEPPEDVSPAFTYYLYNEMADYKMLSCIILDLVMKGYLEIEIEKNKPPYLKRKKRAGIELPYEENLLLETLIGFSGPCPLDERSAVLLEDIRNRIENRFIMKRSKYTVGNERYVIPAVLITLALSIIPALSSSNLLLSIFINICFLMFFVVLTGIVHDPIKKIITGFTNIFIFIMLIFIASLYDLKRGGNMLPYATFSLTQLFFLISLWVTAFYISLIRNVTPLGKKTFEYLNGFKEFLKTAEINRIIASNPIDKERIFCEYLPYASAMDLHNEWMKKSSLVLSSAALKLFMANTRSTDIASYRLKDIFQIIDNRGSNLKR